MFGALWATSDHKDGPSPIYIYIPIYIWRNLSMSYSTKRKIKKKVTASGYYLATIKWATPLPFLHAAVKQSVMSRLKSRLLPWFVSISMSVWQWKKTVLARKKICPKCMLLGTWSGVIWGRFGVILVICVLVCYKTLCQICKRVLACRPVAKRAEP